MTDKSISDPKLMAETERVTREDFELACIREFSHSGHHLGAGVSRAERCERIRTAILREGKSTQRWHASMWTYASAFAQAYQQPLEKGDRRAPQRWLPEDDFSVDDDSSDDEAELSEDP